MKYAILFIVIVAFIISTGHIPFAHAPLDKEPSISINENLVGIWMMREDTNYHDYFVVEKRNANSYAVSYMNKGGDNRRYEHFDMFFSKVGNADFLNVQYPDDRTGTGYVLLRVLTLDHNGFEMTAAVVSDFMLDGLTDPDKVRKAVETNINNPSFYADTLHFRKKLPLHVWK